MSPKIVDKEVKKKEILESAIKVFARNGIANTKVVDIAIEADTSKGNIYTYFESKEEIKLCNIVDDWMNTIKSSYEETKLFIYYWAEGEGEGLKKQIDEYNLKELYNNYRFFLSGILEQGISEGRIYPVDTKLMASVIMGTLDGLILHWIIGKDIFDLNKAIDIFKKSIIEGLRKV